MKWPAIGSIGVRPIHASAHVYCPRSAAIGWARSYFDDRERVVSIGLPLRALGLPTFLRVYRNAVVEIRDVTVRKGSTPRHEDALHVSWRVTHGGPFPTFSGVLTARADTMHAVLDFDGTYAPPFGIVGGVFDRFVGRHIARASVETLLHDMKRYIERLSLDERRATSFAAFEANTRDPHPSGYGVPLHGSIAVRRDGSYVACSIVLEGDAPAYDALLAGERRLSGDHVDALLAQLVKPDLHIAGQHHRN
ncbi:MAG: hypothetical protein NVS1B2_22910 [Vulcanimicrobiaceae bacterium]